MARTMGAKGKRSDALAKQAAVLYGRSAGEQLAALVMVSEADCELAGGLIQAMGHRARIIGASFGLDNEDATKMMMGGLVALLPFHHARMVDVSGSVDVPLVVSMQTPGAPRDYGQGAMMFSRMGQSVPLDMLDLEAVEIKPKQYNEIANTQGASSYDSRRMETLSPCNHSGKGALT